MGRLLLLLAARAQITLSRDSAGHLVVSYSGTPDVELLALLRRHRREVEALLPVGVWVAPKRGWNGGDGRPPRPCDECRTMFKPSKVTARYCSPRCKGRAATRLYAERHR